MEKEFAGDRKKGTWLLARGEERLRDWLLPRVPKHIETYHLTLTTILWCALIIAFSYFASYEIRWLWAVSFSILMQYITDLLDGAVGRERNSGLIKWGFYMDHFLDYLFLCSILIGYSLMLPDQYKFRIIIILALFGAFMVNSFLSFAATNDFRISYLGIGPTEVRLMFILVNTLLVFFGKTHLAAALPYVLVFAMLGLVATVYRTQKIMWDLDMGKKRGGL